MTQTARAVVAIVTLLVGVCLVAAMGALISDRIDGSGDASISREASIAAWDATQRANAARIMAVASDMGLSRRAQQIGVMTAMGESSLRNIDYGDYETSGVTNPDGSPTTSIGLFQQQEGWGSRAERLDPETAARMFFLRLQEIEGWEELEPTQAAHIVQDNSDPEHYAKWWDEAVRVIDEIG